MKFLDNLPPENTGRMSKLRTFNSELKRHKGKWTIYRSVRNLNSARSACSHIRARGFKWQDQYANYESRVVCDDNNNYIVYVRITGYDHDKMNRIDLDMVVDGEN